MADIGDTIVEAGKIAKKSGEDQVQIFNKIIDVSGNVEQTLRRLKKAYSDSLTGSSQYVRALEEDVTKLAKSLRSLEEGSDRYAKVEETIKGLMGGIQTSTQRLEELDRKIQNTFSTNTEISIRKVKDEIVQLREEFAKTGDVDLTERIVKLKEEHTMLMEEQKASAQLINEGKNAIASIGGNLGKLGLSVGGIFAGGGSASVTKMLGEMAKFAYLWYENTMKVNEQYFNIQANLGNIGEGHRDFQKSVDRIAADYKILPEEVRELYNQLAGVGVLSEDLENSAEKTYYWFRKWKTMTPEKQIQMMSMYMKEFGMNSSQARDTLDALFISTDNLKDELSKAGVAFDMEKYGEQVMQVALGIRRYGLEVSDAMVLTKNLLSVGVSQARMPEIAMGIAGIGSGNTGAKYLMTQEYLLPEFQKEIALLEGTSLRTPEQEKRLQLLKSNVGGLERGEVASTMGAGAFAENEQALGMRMYWLNEASKKSFSGRGLQDITEFEATGFLSSGVYQPLSDIGLSEQASREFIEGIKKSGKPFAEAVLQELQRFDTLGGEMPPMLKINEDQLNEAKEIAKITTTIKDEMKILNSRVLDLYTAMFPTNPKLRFDREAGKQISETLSAIGGPAESPEQLSARGISPSIVWEKIVEYLDRLTDPGKQREYILKSEEGSPLGTIIEGVKAH